MAVKLVTGQKIGTISLAGLSKRVEALKPKACWIAPTYKCVLSQTLATAKMFKGDRITGDLSHVKVLRYIAVAQAEAIALAQAKAGDVKQALAIAKTSKDDHDRVWVLQAIAVVQAKAGDTKQAQASQMF